MSVTTGAARRHNEAPRIHYVEKLFIWLLLSDAGLISTSNFVFMEFEPVKNSCSNIYYFKALGISFLNQVGIFPSPYSSILLTVPFLPKKPSSVNKLRLNKSGSLLVKQNGHISFSLIYLYKFFSNTRQL